MPAGHHNNNRKKKNQQSPAFRIDERRRQVAELYLRGMTQLAIARKLGATQGTVCTDIQAIKEQWKQESVSKVEEVITMQLAKIDRLEAMANKAWYRSCRDAETVRRREEQARPDGDGVNDESAQTEEEIKKQADKDLANIKKKKKELLKERRGFRGSLAEKESKSNLVPIKVVEELRRQGQYGDPRFLEEIRRLMELRCKILGVLKPDSSGGGAVNTTFYINWDDLLTRPERTSADEIEDVIRNPQRQLPGPQSGNGANGPGPSNGKSGGHQKP